MKQRIVFWFVLAGMLLVTVAMAACSGTGDSNPQTKPTATIARRTSVPAPTRAAGTSANPTTDALDDSANGTPEEDSGDSDNGPSPTQDALDDSSTADTGTPSGGPQTQNGNVVLPGSAWAVSQVDQAYRFCPNNTWEIVQGGNKVVQKGTFKVTGQTLSLTDSADSKVTEYQMQWNADAKTLELKQGNTTLKLEYDGTADCGG